MKLSDYKALVKSHPQIAMFLDLTERFPRGPKGNIRSKHYVRAGEYYSDRHETKLGEEVLRADKKTRGVAEDCTVEAYGFCSVAYGYDPLELKVFFKKFGCTDQWDVKCKMGELDPGGDCEALSFLRGWNKQATRTRRGKRMGLRMRQLRIWVQENVTTAYYSFNTNYGRIHVHADSEQQAQGQYDLFLKPAVAEMETAGRNGRYESDGTYYPRYIEPAIEGPAGLMGLNEKFVSSTRDQIADAKQRIKQAEEKIAALESGMELIQAYAINMTASYDYEAK